MSGYRRLTQDDRSQIYALHKRGVSQQDIGRHLGVSQSTISRELRRNRGKRGYRFAQAQAMADARQAAHGKPRRLTAGLRSKIVGLLSARRLSPEQISAVLTATGMAISHESIYRMIWRDKREGGTLWQCLRRRGKRYNKRANKSAGRGIIPDRIDISQRPKVVERKTRVGDWEGDTLIGGGHRGAVLTLVERKTRLTKLALLPAATAQATSRAAIRKLRPIQRYVHTITFDNGKEFAGHKEIARALRSRIYFARPYHAWERGLCENTNGLVRDFFPKRTNFANVTPAELARVERLLNSRPRKKIGFRPPAEVFQAALRCR
jgi:IS30 family transposase